jgi:hypothetical protein
MFSAATASERVREGGMAAHRAGAAPAELVDRSRCRSARRLLLRRCSAPTGTGGYRADGKTRSARPCADDRGQRGQSSHENTAAYRVGNGRHAAHRLGIRAYAKRTTPSFRGQAVASAVEVRWVARLAPQRTEPSGLQRLVYGPRVAESACTGCFRRKADINW